ncbi:MAG TPA: YIP1 family protein, partial [Longimicrobiaceae bacterium]|nr:YIP1 family protein [Longimicrobiaceae bacterium]
AKIVPQARIMGLIFSVFGPLIAALFIAAVLFVVSRLAMGGKSSYNQYLAITTHIQIMLALGGVLVAPLIFMKHDPNINLSLTLLFSELTPKSPVFGVLHGLDVFHVWGLILFGMGIAKVDGRRSWLPSTAVLLAVYLLLTVGVPMLLGMILPHPGGA